MDFLNKFTMYFLHKDWFSSRPKFSVVILYYVILFNIILFVGSLLYSFDYQVMLGKDGTLNFFEALKVFGIFISIFGLFYVLNRPLFYIKDFYYTNKLQFDQNFNITMKGFIETLFGEDRSDRELVASQYKLQNFLEVSKPNNDKYIIYGKLERNDYENLYSRFCDIADELLWTKDSSLFNIQEFEYIVDNYQESNNEIIREGHDTIVSTLKKIKGKFSLLTKYDKRFLSGNGEQIRILVVDNFQQNSLGNWNNFLKMLNTDSDSRKQLDTEVYKKRLKDFIGTSKLYFIERDFVKKYILTLNEEMSKKEKECLLNNAIYEFGVYRIGQSLYTLRTIPDKVNKGRFSVSIEVENKNIASNDCNKFYKDILEDKKLHQTCTLGVLDNMEIHYICQRNKK